MAVGRASHFTAALNAPAVSSGVAAAAAGSCPSFAAIALVTSVCRFGLARPLTTRFLPQSHLASCAGSLSAGCILWSISKSSKANSSLRCWPMCDVWRQASPHLKTSSANKFSLVAVSTQSAPALSVLALGLCRATQSRHSGHRWPHHGQRCCAEHHSPHRQVELAVVQHRVGSVRGRPTFGCSVLDVCGRARCSPRAALPPRLVGIRCGEWCLPPAQAAGCKLGRKDYHRTYRWRWDCNN
jgi:hypothetical protein